MIIIFIIFMINKKVTVGNKVLKIIKEVSQGSYGKVYLVENTKDNKEKFALKVTIAQNQERFDLSDKEISFLKEFSKEQNDFFVQYIDSKIKHKNGSYKIYLLMEFCEQGNLFDFIGEKQKQK